jgi:uncharacterized protein YegL
MQTGSVNGKGPAAEGVLHVAFVLDKSGSMQAVEEAVVEGYNEYLHELSEQGGETLFALTTFDTSFNHVCVGEPLAKVAALDHATYRPGGCTALFDAIGHTVMRTDERLATEGRADEKVLLVVMTDGLENSSTDYDAHAIAELVRRYDERPNWTFVYLGAGHETIEAAQGAAMAMSFKADNAMRWAADPDSALMSMKALAHATEARRFSATLKSEQFFADAGQSQADYDAGRAKPKPKPPRKRRPSAIHRRELTDVLRRSEVSGHNRSESS